MSRGDQVASIKCAHCKATHDSVAAVRACSTGAVVAATREERVRPDPFAALEAAGYYKTDLLEREITAVRTPASALPALPAPSPAKATPVRKVTQEELPAGRYALAGMDGVVRFYKVDHGSARSKRWAGFVFVRGLLGSPGAWREVDLSRAERDMIKAKLADDPQAAASLFGQKYRVCGNHKCLSPLSNPQSRAAGYGPDCAANHGWWYPTLAEALVILRERGEVVDE